MTNKRKISKMVIKKYLRNNQSILKRFEKKNSKVRKYNREEWMMRSNPIVDKYEEALNKERDFF